MSNKKRYFQIALLIIAAGSIYTLPYIRTNFEQTLIEVFELNMASFSNLYAVLGLMFIIGYVPSGWLADKYSSKILIVVSLITTSLAGMYMATIPPAEHLLIIFLIWGISTVFTFWSSLIKGIKLLAKAEEQAKVFGILDGGRGLVEASMATIAMLLFSQISTISDSSAGLQAVILFYSVILFVIGILIAIFMSNPEQKNEEDKVKASFKDVIIVLKKKEVWLMSGVIFCGYTVFWTTYYLGGFLQVTHNISAVAAGTITTSMMWMRPIGGIGGGFLGDKFGKYKIVMISMIFSSVFLLLLSLMPLSTSIVILGILVMLVGLTSYALRGLYWSFLDDLNLEPKILGIAIGLISFIGYLPDILIPKLTSPIFSLYNDGPEAYKIYFIVSVIIAVIGVVITLIFSKFVNMKSQSNNL